MKIGMVAIIVSFIYILLINIIYFSKNRVSNFDNRIYSRMLLLNTLGLVLEFLCYITVPNVDKMFILNEIINRLFLLYIATWTVLLIIYEFKEIFGLRDKKGRVFVLDNKILNFIILGAYAVTIITALVAKIEYYNDQHFTYSYGIATDFVFLPCIISFLLGGISIYIYRKKINFRKVIPFFALFFVLGIAVLLRLINPGLLFITPVLSFVTILMYFTIENPDVQMLEQVEFAKEQAERANKAKTDFLSAMSHEIRTPLNAIVGFSQSLKTEDLSESAMEEVDDIIEASETLLDTVNGVLDISKIEANKIEIVNSIYNFHKVFDELVALSKARLGDEKPITFKYELAPDTPMYLYGDYARVKQIALNFLTNAIKYTNEGYIDFKVKNIINDGLCRLIITVEDSGIGIKKEAINKLFNKFERLDNENSTIEGTGLGLAITKKLVELMHGKIIVQSVFGKGSQFMVILDQKLVEEKDIPKEESRVAQTGAVVNYDYSSKKILIVDDNKLNLKVAVRLLKPYNVQTEEVSSGAECLDLIGGGNKYDLILMDDMMPKMSGKETFKKLKEDEGFNIPVVILTANAITGMKEQYLAEGFNDYLAKPIERSELERVLRKYLG